MFAIEPFVARFDLRDNVRSGWQEEVGDDTARRRGVRDYEVMAGKAGDMEKKGPQ